MIRQRLKNMLAKTAMRVPLLAAAPPSNVQDHLQDMSTSEKIRMYTEYSDIAQVIAGLGLIFAIFIFTILFLRRWNVPRMGYFLVTALTLASRFQFPEMIFWKTVAFAAGAFSLIMFLLAHRNVDFDSRKEPLYFLFNSFSLLLVSFTVNFYFISMSSMSLVASLFFVISKKPVPHGKFKKHDADEKIMESLAERAKRPL